MLDALGIGANVGPIAGVLGLYILFMLASGIRGLSSGISQAMEISLIAQSAGLAGQGKGAALRVTVGRVAAVILPVFMGAIAKFFGLDAAFYVVGGTILPAHFAPDAQQIVFLQLIRPLDAVIGNLQGMIKAFFGNQKRCNFCWIIGVFSGHGNSLLVAPHSMQDSCQPKFIGLFRHFFELRLTTSKPTVKFTDSQSLTKAVNATKINSGRSAATRGQYQERWRQA
jgi:hypothetical protein